MVKQYIFIVIISNLIICSNLSSEITNNFNFILQVKENKSLKIRKKQTKITDVSELKMFLLGLIRFYQKFISSQDADSCMFTVSCSHFSFYAIKHYGPFWGILMTLDRIQRCNGMGYIYYNIDIYKNKAIDYPIQLYYLPESEDVKY